MERMRFWYAVWDRQALKLFVILGGATLAFLLGALVGTERLQLKGLVVVMGAMAVLPLVLLGGQDILRMVYLFAIASFGLGHRSVYVGQYSFFVPAELAAWLVCVVIIIRMLLERELPNIRLPKALLFLFIWCIFGLLTTPELALNYDAAFNMFKLWVVAVPIFIITAVLVTRMELVKQAINLVVLAALSMSILAIVEYWLPGVARTFPWLYDLRLENVETIEGFRRSYFTFWGNSIGVIVVGWGMLAAFDQILNGKSGVWRFTAAATLALGFLALYSSGQRASWIAVPAGLCVLAVLSGKSKALAMVLVFIPMFLVPDSFWNRVEALVPGTTYFENDTSVGWRTERYQWALEQIAGHPLFGIGLGGGLTHNEFLAFAVRIGLPAMIAFIALIGSVFWKMWQASKNAISAADRRITALFLALMMTWLIDLNSHPVLGVAPIAVPYWFMIALAWRIPRLVQEYAKQEMLLVAERDAI